jgi:HD-GYP domain-containing protein (c-di-GMP phosphodiesterase class II)
MIDSPSAKAFFKTSYHGHILHERYSLALKRYVRSAIARFVELDSLGLSVIPYISAWHEHEGKSKIWYEYSGHLLPLLLGCSSANVAGELRKRVIDRSTYTTPNVSDSITQEVINRQELFRARSKLRNEVKKTGLVEAIYKIVPATGQPFCLKDQANIEIYLNDGVCLSVGLLFLVTKEMQAEEELRETKAELQRHRAHLTSIVQARTKELKDTQLEIVYRLARAAEFRDKWTGQHIFKMSNYCTMLGNSIGLSDRKNTLLFQAAPMHDIGKIGISDKILLKPGKLTTNEFKIMKSHSKIGANLLSGPNSDLIKVAKNIALTHHEKWDGSGYPGGLIGTEIPLAGRIIAVCDVFDALTSQRPYKKPWPIDKAIAELKLNAGAHFDPRLVRAFIKNVPRIKKIHKSSYL